MSLYDALQVPLFGSNTILTKSKRPATQPLVDFYTTFHPRQHPSLVAVHHFMSEYRHLAVPAPPQYNGHFSDKAHLIDTCEFGLVRWTVHRLQSIAKQRPEINYDMNKILQADSGLPTLQADFLFTHTVHGHATKVAAILQVKAVRSLEPKAWEGTNAMGPDEQIMTKEVRALAVQFDTRVIMFFDGETLVRFCFRGDRQLFQPDVWVLKDGQGQAFESIRHGVFYGVCHGVSTLAMQWV